MAEAFISDPTRSPISRYAGALRGAHADDLAAHPVPAPAERNIRIDRDAPDARTKGRKREVVEACTTPPAKLIERV